MAEEVVRIRDRYYIVSTSARIDDRTQVLKHGDTFANLDRFGDIERFGTGDLGLYHMDTRYLSRLELQLGEVRPLLLSSTIMENNAGLAVDLTNPDIWREDEADIPRGALHIYRAIMLWDATCHQHLRIHNYGDAPVGLTLSIILDADFADIFEVRGLERERRGEFEDTQMTRDAMLYGYAGLDGIIRRTLIVFDKHPTRMEEKQAQFRIDLQPRSEVRINMAVFCQVDEAAGSNLAGRERGKAAGGSHGSGRNRIDRRLAKTISWYDQAAVAAAADDERAKAGDPEVFTSNDQFNEWLNRSVVDLHMLRTETGHGPYPYAGVPWFSTVFGRDGIITALESLWFNPAIARGVLGYLAATQADEDSDSRDSRPGKVIHEVRAGEMANLGEVPFGRYYGSVDATPLFVVLAGAYYERTGDREFPAFIWPHVERALAWINDYGDIDGDGFVEYSRRSPGGLDNQGWKDSHDAVFHADGRLAEPPITLCEVQGYVYAAKKAAAVLAGALGGNGTAGQLLEEAEALRQRFDEAFWCEELSTYALALDGSKEQCRVVTSNAGHCLFSGIAREDRARLVADTLTNDESFSGWGLRTVAISGARYNPMSYHNGSVWPHDNALVSAGFARYGLRKEAMRILESLFDASRFFELQRLPELFCGFHRRPGVSPTLYPTSCSPQAWAAGAVLLLLQSCLGLEVRGVESKLFFNKALLPDFIDELSIKNLHVGDARLDLLLTRHELDVAVNVLFREGHADVVAIK